MDQNCTTTQYANGQSNTGCIGTATSTHGGLPVTGFAILPMVAVALLVILLGFVLWGVGQIRAH